MRELFVSINGNDENDGSKSKPFKTLRKAKAAVRKLLKNEDITIYIREGRYFFEDTFELSEADSGNENCRIAYKAYEGENVIFDGGFVLDNKLVMKTKDKNILNRIIDINARGHIHEIDLSGYDVKYGTYGTRGFRRAYVNSDNELFIDGQPQCVAQYPNKDCDMMPITEVIDPGSNVYEKEFDLRGGIFKYDDDRCSLWKNCGDVYASGIFNWVFSDDTICIKNIDVKNKTIETELPHLESFMAQPYTGWYAINLLEEIDVPGEYYIDKENKKLYFYPPYDIKQSLLQLSNMTVPFIAMEGTAYVELSGIIFENSRGTGVYIEGGHHCKIQECIFRNLGMLAVQIGQGAEPLPEGLHNAHGVLSEGLDAPKSAGRIMGSWHEMIYQFAGWDNNGGHDNGIEGCEIYDTGTGGVLLGGGNRKNLIPANNYVVNTKIYRVNRLDTTYKAGVNICGVGNRVANCEIFDLPGFAIYLHGNDHVIEYNKIHEVIKNVGDAGAIYMGRDLSEVGNVFRYNFIYNLNGHPKATFGVCAIYFDDYNSFNSVYENYFYNIKSAKRIEPFSVIFHNCGGQTSINNNIFIDCDCAINSNQASMRSIKLQLGADKLFYNRVTAKEDDMTGVDILSDKYKEKYPYLAEVFVGSYKNECHVWNNITVFGDYRPFKNAEEYDFTIITDDFKEYSQVYIYDILMNRESDKEFFDIIDFNKIGLIS